MDVMIFMLARQVLNSDHDPPSMDPISLMSFTEHRASSSTSFSFSSFVSKGTAFL